MNKTVVRKGLFETASSSEDSLSVYQEMKLYILPAEEYDLFKNNQLYVKFSNTIPYYTDDKYTVIADNAEQIKLLKLSPEEVKDHLTPDKETPFIYVPRWIGDFPHNLRNFYTTYNALRYAASRYYSEVQFFEYENNGDVIFGFYGYFEN